jgi:hypothetical protein
MLLNVIPWTRINKTAFWNSVSFKYSEPYGRDYHNIAHVIRLYNYAAKLKIPYDVNLDFAILVHDMIYDDQPNKEIRTNYEFIKMITKSIGLGMNIPEKAYLEGIVIEPLKIVDMVNTTINHSPMNNLGLVSNDLLMLDLYNFATKDRVGDFHILFDECVKLYPNVKKEDILENIKLNLIRLDSNLSVFVDNVDEKNVKYYNAWVDINLGIKEQIKYVDGIINKK